MSSQGTAGVDEGECTQAGAHRNGTAEVKVECRSSIQTGGGEMHVWCVTQGEVKYEVKHDSETLATNCEG